MDQVPSQNKTDMGEPTSVSEAETPKVAEISEDTMGSGDSPWVEMDSGLSENRRNVRKAFMNQRTGEVRNPVIGRKVPRQERLFLDESNPHDEGRMFEVKIMPENMTAMEVKDLKEKLDQERQRLANEEPNQESTDDKVQYLLMKLAMLESEVGVKGRQVIRLEDQLVREKFKAETSQEQENATKECLKQATRKTHELTRNHEREKLALTKNFQRMIDGMMQALPSGEAPTEKSTSDIGDDGPAVRWAESVAEVALVKEAWRVIYDATNNVHKQIQTELQGADFLLPGEWGRSEGLDRVRLPEYPALQRRLLNNRWDKARENCRRLICSLSAQGPIIASLEGYPGEADPETRSRLEKARSKAAWHDLASRTKFVLDTIEAGKQQQLLTERELVKSHIGVQRTNELAQEAILSDRTLGRMANTRLRGEEPGVIELSSRESMSSLAAAAEDESRPTI